MNTVELIFVYKPKDSGHWCGKDEVADLSVQRLSISN